MRRILLPTTALLVAAIALAGCSAGAGSSDSGGGAPAPAQDSDNGSISSESSGGDVAVSPEFESTDRQVITTGYVTVTVDDPIAGAREAVRITESVGGRVDSRNEYAADDSSGGSATLTLRIPSDDLTATLDKLKALGVVEEVSLNASDVTMQSLDLDARISSMADSIARLQALVPTAASLDDLITLETAISDRQAQLESMQSEQRYLADQVSMSSITFNLVEEYIPPVPEVEGSDPGAAFQRGLVALATFFGGLITVLAFMAPGLAVLAVIAAIVIVIVRLVRRRGRTTPTPPATPAA
jgi:hypothetical protein